MSKLSEDEIIKDLKNFIALAQKEENFIYYSEYKFDNELSERVQGLLDLYNKEKEKNEKYQEVISNLNKNWISKEYLKTKLNNLKEKEQELSDEQGYWGGTKLQDKIEFYEELLEERN